MSIRRTVGRELFAWLFSSALVVFYIQPRVSIGGPEAVALVLLIELVGFLIGWTLAGSGKRGTVIRSLAVPALLSLAIVLIFQPTHGTADTIFLSLLIVQVAAAAVALAVVPAKRPSSVSSG